MGKKEILKEELRPLFESFFKAEQRKELFAYITRKSDLPGPRANLELADAFSDLVEEYATEDSGKTWGLLNVMMAFSPDEAPVNNPREFLSFCGVIGIAALTSACSQFLNSTLEKLRAMSEDRRWRIREAVAKSLQKLLVKYWPETLKALQSWLGTDNWLVMRAVAAGVAEPSLLKQLKAAKASFELHQKILSAIITCKERKSEPFRILRKTLGYTLSVIVECEPTQGFAYLHKLAKSEDSDIRWIINENLKKNRLIKNFPDEVTNLKHIVEK